MIDDDLLDRLLGLAHGLADAGGAAALSWFRKPGLGAENKAAGGAWDPVTAADRAAEEAMRAILAAERPEDAILGEEAGATRGSSGLTWILDPIDGTRSFLCGLPTWGVLVALDDGTRARIGIVDQPHTGERFVGVPGRGPGRGAWLAHRGGQRSLGVRPCPGLGEATMLTTAPEMFGADEMAGFREIDRRTRLTRYGTDCYGYAMLAAGLVDLVVEAGLGAYDIAAPGALVRAAGGIVTDWRGGDCRAGGRVIAAGDPRVHAEALEILSRV